MLKLTFHGYGEVRVLQPSGTAVELSTHVERTALALAGCGVNSRVAIAPAAADQAVRAIGSYLAVLTVGGVPVFLRPRDQWSKEDMLEVGIDAVVSDSDVKVINGGSATGRDDEGLVLFTSGSTSRPKGVRFSGDAVLHNLDATGSYLQVTARDVVGIPLPIHYTYGLSMLNLAVRTGASMHMCNYEVPPASWLGDLRRVGCTVLALLPHQARLLVRVGDFGAQTLPDVRAITIAGGATDEATSKALSSRFPDAEVFLMYGQTEAGPRISYLPPDELARHALSIGRGIPGWTELRVASPDASGAGELQVRSASVMLGYLDPNEPVPITEDGWLATGDIVRMTTDGYFYVLARARPFYKPFGERVGYEELLRAAAAIVQGAELRLEPIEHPILGESVRLHAVLDPELPEVTADTLRLALQKTLGRSRAPHEVVVSRRDTSVKLW
jgi:long-chain acyl-CoA synthetase